MRDFGFNGCLEFSWAEASGASSTGVKYALIGVDEVEAFGPGGVGDHDGIVYFVNIGLDAVLHGYFTLACYLAAFFYGCGIVNTCVFEFPAVFGVGFADVDNEELDFFVVLRI